MFSSTVRTWVRELVCDEKDTARKYAFLRVREKYGWLARLGGWRGLEEDGVQYFGCADELVALGPVHRSIGAYPERVLLCLDEVDVTEPETAAIVERLRHWEISSDWFLITVYIYIIAGGGIGENRQTIVS